MAKAKKRTSKKVHGRNGLGVIATWTKLFQENARRKLTDEQISAEMHKNFPGRASKIFDHVAAVRSRYNAGVLTKGEIPKVKAIRYDADGKELTTRGRAKKVAKKTAKPKGKKAETTEQ